MTNRTLGIKSFAVPILDTSGAVCAEVVAAMRRVNHLLMRKLAEGGFSAGNFMR